MTRNRVIAALLAMGIGGAAFLIGCEGDHQMARLDAEAAMMIARRERYTLGDENPKDPQAVPGRVAGPAANNLAYATKPPTRSPGPGDLPAAPATEPPSTQPTRGIVFDNVEEAKGATVYTLEDTLNYAIEHAPDYRGQKESLFLTVLSLLIERHMWEPHFFDNVTAQANGNPEGGDHEQAAKIINEFGVTQKLPYGGNIAASALVDYTTLLRKSSGSAPDAEGGQAGAKLALSLPLLRGAGKSAREDLYQAERNVIYASRTFERFRRQFLVDISTRYYDLLLQEAGIRNQKLQVSNFEWLERRVDALARAGRQPFFEVEQARQQVLFARNDLVNAQEAYASSLDSFKLLIGMPIEQRLALKMFEVGVTQPDLEKTTAVKAALALRLDLQTASDQMDDAARKVEVARNQLLPDLDLFADVALNASRTSRLTDIFTINGDGSTYAAGVTLGLPLDRRTEQLQLRQAMVNVERAERSYNLERDQVTIDVRRAIRQIEQAQFTLELQNRNIDIAKVRLRGVLLRLRTLPARDFIDAQTDLLSARNRRDAAVRDLRVSILNFLLATEQIRVTSDGQWLLPAKLAAVTPPAIVPDPIQLLEPNAIEPSVATMPAE